MKTYGEIDLDETPVVVLGCCHFFTAETLDGMFHMSKVYELDGNEEITGLKDVSFEMASRVPRCPDCNCPIRQFATQRYNRIINRAVIDEMSKRFLVSGQMAYERSRMRLIVHNNTSKTLGKILLVPFAKQ